MTALNQLSFVFLIAVLSGISPRSASQTAQNSSPPQQKKEKALTLYFKHEIDKTEATWLVRPYGLKIIKITEITPAISFSIPNTNQRRAQVESLQDDKISQSIREFIEIPPKIFVIPNSKDDLNEILRVLTHYDLRPTRDSFPATAELGISKDEIEEWKTRLALDSGVAMVGEDGTLYATRNFDLPGTEYADLRMRLVSASKSFSFFSLDPRMPGKLPSPHKSQPLPLTPQDLSTKCTASAAALSNPKTTINTVVYRFFGGRPNEQFPEFIPIQIVDGEVTEYMIAGVKGLVTKHDWEYYELIMEYSASNEGVKLRAYIQGWSEKMRSPSSKKDVYRENLEAESTQQQKLKSKLEELLGDIGKEFCILTQPKVASDPR